MENICFFVLFAFLLLLILMLANTPSGMMMMMSKTNVDFKQHHVIVFFVDRCSGWLSSRATEHVCEQEVGDESKTKGRWQFLLECVTNCYALNSGDLRNAQDRG